MRRTIVIRAGITCRGDEQNIVLVSFANHLFKRARSLRRSPTRADDAHVHAGFLPIDHVINRLNRIFGRAETTRVHKLQWHDLNFPVHTSNAEIIFTFRADDTCAVGAMTVLVHWIGSVIDCVEAVLIVDCSEFVVVIGGHVVLTSPHVAGKIAAVEHSNYDIFAAGGFGPGERGTDVGTFFAASLT